MKYKEFINIIAESLENGNYVCISHVDGSEVVINARENGRFFRLDKNRIFTFVKDLLNELDDNVSIDRLYFSENFRITEYEMIYED